MNSHFVLARTDNRDDDAASCATVHVRLRGVYSINGRYSLLCSIEGISDRGLSLCVMVKPAIGDHIVAIFDIIGRVDGLVSEITNSGVVMSLDATTHDGLRGQLAFLASSSLDKTQRRHFRIRPKNPETTIQNASRTACPALVTDFSISGACIETKVPLTVGETIVFARRTRATIVRNLGDYRFGVEFEREFRPQDFTWHTRL